MRLLRRTVDSQDLELKNALLTRGERVFELKANARETHNESAIELGSLFLPVAVTTPTGCATSVLADPQSSRHEDTNSVMYG